MALKFPKHKLFSNQTILIDGAIIRNVRDHYSNKAVAEFLKVPELCVLLHWYCNDK